jgi:hypothetical protein
MYTATKAADPPAHLVANGSVGTDDRRDRNDIVAREQLAPIRSA